MTDSSKMDRFVFRGSAGPMSYLTRPGETNLILIHGFTASAEIWRDLIEYLDPSFGVTCVDLFGHGESPIPEGGMQGLTIGEALRFQCSAINELLEHLEITKYVSIGSSMGGWLSLELASRFRRPEKAVLIDPAGIVPISDNRFSEGLGNLVAEFSKEKGKFAEILSGIMLNASPEDFQMDGRILEGIKFPVSVIWGGNDEILDAESGRAFAGRIVGGQFHLIGGAEHVPFRSHPREVAELINRFVLKGE